MYVNILYIITVDKYTLIYNNCFLFLLFQNGFAIIKEGIKISNSLPCEDNFKYYTCFSSFNNARKYQTDRILKLIQSIIEATGIVDSITRRDIEEKLDLLVEANDIFLDRAVR